MKTVMAALVVVLGLSGAATAQDGKEKGKKEAKEPSIGLKDIDTNNDGRASVSELQARSYRAMNRVQGDCQNGVM